MRFSHSFKQDLKPRAQFESLWPCSDELGVGMSVNNSTVSVAGSFETDGDGTVGYEVENKSPREMEEGE